MLTAPLMLEESLWEARGIQKKKAQPCGFWGVIKSGGHQVVGFVALRQNKPA